MASVNALRDLIARFATREGSQPGPWAGLTFIKSSEPVPRGGVIYAQCLCFVAEGRKRAYLGGESYTYDPMNYLVLSVPLPLEAEIVEASPERPFLAMSLDVDATLVSELVLEMGGSVEDDEPAERGIHSSPMSPEILDPLVRFLRALEDPLERRVLAPTALRELLFRVLTGSQAAHLRRIALRDSHSHHIARVLRYLHSQFERPIDVPAIAREAGMSVSTLHHRFKALTSLSPMQYLKKVRLHRARALMLHEGLNAGEAAFRVGYASPSQFSREYKRLFGTSPAREVDELRGRLGAGGHSEPSTTNQDTLGNTL